MLLRTFVVTTSVRIILVSFAEAIAVDSTNNAANKVTTTKVEAISRRIWLRMCIFFLGRRFHL